MPKKKEKNIEKLLEEWSVHEPGSWKNDTGPENWYAVSNDEGIIAYFRDEKDAFAYRLNKINQILNG